MKIGLYGFDVISEKVLKIIADAAVKKGHDTVMFPSQEPGIAAKRKEEMRDCDVVAMKLASFQTEEELVLADYLLSHTVPIVVVEDVPGSSLRPKAKEFASHAAAVLVTHPAYIKKALAFGYCHAYYIGPSPQWGAGYREMLEATEKRSSLLNTLHSVRGDVSESISEKDDVILYVPGSKHHGPDTEILRCVRDAGVKIFGDDRLVLGFAEHPGEKKQMEKDHVNSALVYAKRADILKGVRTLDRGTLSNAQMVALAHLTVFSGGPNESWIGAYARSCIAYFYNDDVRALLRGQGEEGGSWPVAELGGAYIINGPEEMESAIKHLFTEAGRNELRVAQEKAFPLPETWNTAPKIVKFLEKVAGQM